MKKQLQDNPPFPVLVVLTKTTIFQYQQHQQWGILHPPQTTPAGACCSAAALTLLKVHLCWLFCTMQGIGRSSALAFWAQYLCTPKLLHPRNPRSEAEREMCSGLGSTGSARAAGPGKSPAFCSLPELAHRCPALLYVCASTRGRDPGARQTCAVTRRSLTARRGPGAAHLPAEPWCCRPSWAAAWRRGSRGRWGTPWPGSAPRWGRAAGCLPSWWFWGRTPRPLRPRLRSRLSRGSSDRHSWAGAWPTPPLIRTPRPPARPPRPRRRPAWRLPTGGGLRKPSRLWGKRREEASRAVPPAAIGNGRSKPTTEPAPFSPSARSRADLCPARRSARCPARPPPRAAAVRRSRRTCAVRPRAASGVQPPRGGSGGGRSSAAAQGKGTARLPAGNKAPGGKRSPTGPQRGCVRYERRTTRAPLPRWFTTTEAVLSTQRAGLGAAATGRTPNARSEGWAELRASSRAELRWKELCGYRRRPPAPGIASVWNRTAFWPCLKTCPGLQPAQNGTQLRRYRPTTPAASPSSPGSTASTATAREMGVFCARPARRCVGRLRQGRCYWCLSDRYGNEGLNNWADVDVESKRQV